MGITIKVMEQEKRLSQILELEREIAMLPEGSITKKILKEKIITITVSIAWIQRPMIFYLMVLIIF